jgi:transposase
MRSTPSKQLATRPPSSRLPSIVLSAEERHLLESWRRARGAGARRSMRARIVLDCANGVSNREVARHLRIPTQTVGKWRSRFLAERMPGLLDQPRSGAPRSISDEIVEAVLTMTLHEPPPGAGRWSSRRLAHELGISQRAVLRIWRAFEL